jgi:dienelactone hydrolase
VNIQPGVKAGDEAPSPDYSIHPTATIAMSTKPGSFRLVRQLVSLVFLATSVWIRAAEPVQDQTQAAKDFVGLLSRGDSAGALKQCDGAMLAALPGAKLKEIWQSLTTQAGPFQKQLQTRTEKMAGYDIVFVTSQFEKAKVDIKVVLNSKRQVAGLFFLPGTEPAAPPPYVRPDAFREQPVTVGQGKWALPGTLSLPLGSGQFPAVVLVHGSGPCDRDETVGPNKPFSDLAQGLASQGIAVLRYEKRTKQYPTECVALGAQLTVKDETIDDAVAAVALLGKTPGVDPNRIFVLGHSLGGMVAPRIAKAAPAIAGLVIMAAGNRGLEDAMIEQMDYIASLQPNRSAEESKPFEKFKTEMAKVKALTTNDVTSSTSVLGAPPRYWLDLRGYVPARAAQDLKCPLLILQGGRDYQATVTDYEIWQENLKGKTSVTFKLYPSLNHLFISGEGKCTPAEYEKPGHVAAEVVRDIAQWLSKPAS